MIHIGLPLAVPAVMHLSAQFRGAAREHRLRRAVMRAGKQVAVRGGKAPPVRRKDRGQFHKAARPLANASWAAG